MEAHLCLEGLVEERDDGARLVEHGRHGVHKHLAAALHHQRVQHLLQVDAQRGVHALGQGRVLHHAQEQGAGGSGAHAPAAAHQLAPISSLGTHATCAACSRSGRGLPPRPTQALTLHFCTASSSPSRQSISPSSTTSCAPGGSAATELWYCALG